MTRSKTKALKQSHPGRVSVLVAHDEAYVGYSLAGILTSCGCEVIGPVLDLEILQTLGINTDPDVILIGDIPMISTTLILTLRGRYPSAVIIGFDTDATQGGDLETNIYEGSAQGLDAIFPGCLTKPDIISRIQVLTARAARASSCISYPVQSGALVEETSKGSNGVWP